MTDEPEGHDDTDAVGTWLKELTACRTREAAFRKDGQRIPGTGLGLNIVAKAVAELSGQIKVESQLGKGSTFYVSIPRQAGVQS